MSRTILNWKKKTLLTNKQKLPRSSNRQQGLKHNVLGLSRAVNFHTLSFQYNYIEMFSFLFFTFQLAIFVTQLKRQMSISPWQLCDVCYIAMTTGLVG